MQDDEEEFDDPYRNIIKPIKILSPVNKKRIIEYGNVQDSVPRTKSTISVY